MAKPNSYYDSNSLEFKQYMQGLSIQDRSYAVPLIQSALSIRNSSNVQLWFSDGVVQRRYLNRNLSAEDQDIRVCLLDGLAGRRTANGPQKARDIFGDPQTVGSKLREYLTLDYFQRAVTLIQVFNGGITLVYDTYTFDDDEAIDDSDSEEFGDVITP